MGRLSACCFGKNKPMGLEARVYQEFYFFRKSIPSLIQATRLVSKVRFRKKIWKKQTDPRIKICTKNHHLIRDRVLSAV